MAPKLALKPVLHREPYDLFDWRSEHKKLSWESRHPERLQQEQLKFLAKIEDAGSSVCLDDAYITFCFFWGEDYL